MKIIKFRLTEVPVSKIKKLKINPPTRIEKDKLCGLKKLIEKTGIIMPIVLFYNEKENDYTIVDGNRRFIIALELNIVNIQALLIKDTKMTIEELFILLNTQLNMDGKQKIYLARNGGLYFSKKYESKYLYCLNLGGIEIIDMMIERKVGIENYYFYLMQLTKAYGITDSEIFKKILFYMVDGKESLNVRRALERKLNKTLVMQYINSGKSLRTLFN